MRSSRQEFICRFESWKLFRVLNPVPNPNPRRVRPVKCSSCSNSTAKSCLNRRQPRNRKIANARKYSPGRERSSQKPCGDTFRTSLWKCLCPCSRISILSFLHNFLQFVHFAGPRPLVDGQSVFRLQPEFASPVRRNHRDVHSRFSSREKKLKPIPAIPEKSSTHLGNNYQNSFRSLQQPFTTPQPALSARELFAVGLTPGCA